MGENWLCNSKISKTFLLSTMEKIMLILQLYYIYNTLPLKVWKISNITYYDMCNLLKKVVKRAYFSCQKFSFQIIFSPRFQPNSIILKHLLSLFAKKYWKEITKSLQYKNHVTKWQLFLKTERYYIPIKTLKNHFFVKKYKT